MPSFGYKVRVNTPGIDQAPEIYSFYIERHLEKLGEELVGDVRREQRKDTGQERERTRYAITRRVRGGLTFRLSVYNTVVQALVDETGARPHFPPYRKGSKLFAWVSRKGLGGRKLLTSQARAIGQLLGKGAVKQINLDVDKQTERVSFLIARAISRRGLPRPGDPLRAPFKDVEAMRRSYIRGSFSIPFALASMRVNAETRKGAGA